MGWLGRLDLHYTRDSERTVALDRHEGPLRVLQRLYPEGPGICHHVLVHPPGGIAGGDVLQVDLRMDEGTHAVITTPGATRFYRSDDEVARQETRLQLAAGARCEWLPLETIVYRGCLGENRVHIDLAPGAEAMGWEMLALGLPAAGQPYDHGSFLQHLQLDGHWLERGRIDATDLRLLDSPLGWAGHRVLATLWWAAGEDLSVVRRDGLLEAARHCAAESPLAAACGSTSPNPRVVVLRVLAHRVEPAMALLSAVRGAWRQLAWAADPAPVRIWRM